MYQEGWNVRQHTMAYVFNTSERGFASLRAPFSVTTNQEFLIEEIELVVAAHKRPNAKLGVMDSGVAQLIISDNVWFNHAPIQSFRKSLGKGLLLTSSNDSAVILLDWFDEQPYFSPGRIAVYLRGNFFWRWKTS